MEIIAHCRTTNIVQKQQKKRQFVSCGLIDKDYYYYYYYYYCCRFHLCQLLLHYYLVCLCTYCIRNYCRLESNYNSHTMVVLLATALDNTTEARNEIN